MTFRGIIAILCILLSLLAGCSKDPLSPFQPEITNVQDNFQFQATGIKDVTTTKNYNWQNTDTTANVNQSCVITRGSATLTILDADGTQVYSGNLTDNGTFVTTSGTTGTWVIRVELTGLSGTLNFRVQKP
jgi:hypothetical protein